MTAETRSETMWRCGPRARRIAALAAIICATLGGTAKAVASTAFDPFRPAAAGAARLDPFRPDQTRAQAEQAPPEQGPDSQGVAPGGGQASPPESGSPAAPPATNAPTTENPAAPAAPPAPIACTTDEQCPSGTICERGTCTPVQPRTNIAYLYYHEGSFREVLLLYWSKSGSTGYRVLFPLLWQFWSPSSRTTVVLNTSYTREGDAWSFGFWPLLYASNRFGWAAPPLGSFHLLNPAEGTSTGAFAFLYWWRRTPTKKFDLFFPFFVRNSTPDSGFWWALPFNLGWRTGDVRNTLVFPLAYHRATKDGELVVSPVGYERRTPTEVHGSAAWLYWYGEDKKAGSSYEVLFPLLWSFRGPERDTTVFANFLHWRRGQSRLSTFFPIVWVSRDDAKDEGWGTVFPLALWWRSDGGRRAGFASPLGGYLRSDAEQRWSLAFLPGIFMSRDRDSEVDFLTPLYVRAKDKNTGAVTRSIGIFWYDRTDQAGSTKAFWPFFWRFRDSAGSTATALLPFYANRSRPGDQSTAVGVFPVMAYWRKLTDGWGGGLFPLAFFGRQRDRSHAVIPALLFGHVSDSNGSTTVSPVYYRTRDAGGGHTGLPPLLTFWGERDGRAYAVQFPLFWHFADRQHQTSTTVTPLYFQHKEPDGWRMGAGPLLPIFWAGRTGPRSHQVLFPLFWHFRDDSQQSDSTVFLTAFHRRRGGETTDALLPLFWYRRGAAPGGQDETSLTIFPLLHFRRSPDNELVLSPIAAWSRTAQHKVGFVGPYLWFENATFSARGIPLLWADVTRKDTGVRTRQYGLLFMADGQGAARRLLFPFWASYSDAHTQQTWIVPTFYRAKWDDGTSVTAAPPLFWWSNSPTASTRTLLTWYHRATPSSTSTGLLPLWAYGRNLERSYVVIPPLLTAGRWSRDRAWWLTGPVFYSREGDTKTAVGFPIWWAHTTPDRSWRAAFPFYWHWSSSSEDRSATIAGPAFWFRQGSWSTGGTALPLPMWRTIDERSGAGATSVLPLFYERHAPGERMLLTLLGGAGQSPSSNFWYVLTAFSRRTPDTSFAMLAPFWFRYHDKATDTRTTVIPPLALYSRSAPDRSLTTALLLFWRRADVASSTSVALPLFYDVHDYHQQRTTVLLPLFIRHRDDAAQSVTWLAPLWYSRRAPNESTTVLFPLVWDFKRADSRTTVVFPFYVGVDRPTYSATYVFPSYFYKEGRGPNAGTYRRILFPLFETAVKRPGDYMWEVVLGLFGSERIGVNRYVKVFFFTFEVDKPNRSQTSWFSNPPHSSEIRSTSMMSSW